MVDDDSIDKLLSHCETLRRQWVADTVGGGVIALMARSIHRNLLLNPDAFTPTDAIQRLWNSLRLLGGSVPVQPTSESEVDALRAVDIAVTWLMEKKQKVADLPLSSNETLPESLDVETRAIGVFMQNQGWTKKQVAEAIGTDPKYLYDNRHKRFHAVWKAAQSARSVAVPHGSKSADTGIEAIGDEDLDFGEMDDRM